MNNHKIHIGINTILILSFLLLSNLSFAQMDNDVDGQTEDTVIVISYSKLMHQSKKNVIKNWTNKVDEVFFTYRFCCKLGLCCTNSIAFHKGYICEKEYMNSIK